MRVITLLNQKGGVGKTSTCHHVAGTLSLDGHRVLLIDNDPQASLTQGLLGPEVMLALNPSRTVTALYRGDEPIPGRLILPTGLPGVDILPGAEAAMDYNVPKPHGQDRVRRLCIKEFLKDVDYDYVLIDVPPNLHLCSWAALAASSHVIVPMQPEDYGAQGISPINRSVAAVAASDSPGLSILGYLLTMVVPRRAVHRLYEERLRANYGGLVFEAIVPALTDFPEALAVRKPVAQHRPKGPGARAIRGLVDELYRRLEESLRGVA